MVKYFFTKRIFFLSVRNRNRMDKLVQFKVPATEGTVAASTAIWCRVHPFPLQKWFKVKNVGLLVRAISYTIPNILLYKIFAD